MTPISLDSATDTCCSLLADGMKTLASNWNSPNIVALEPNFPTVRCSDEPEAYPIQFVYPTSRLLSVKVRALIGMAVTTQDWNFQAI